eukprot:COSAG05_NODE_8658_length_683_cov_0.630137_1_plen_88_part_01
MLRKSTAKRAAAAASASGATDDFEGPFDFRPELLPLKPVPKGGGGGTNSGSRQEQEQGRGYLPFNAHSGGDDPVLPSGSEAAIWGVTG